MVLEVTDILCEFLTFLNWVLYTGGINTGAGLSGAINNVYGCNTGVKSNLTGAKNGYGGVFIFNVCMCNG